MATMTEAINAWEHRIGIKLPADVDTGTGPMGFVPNVWKDIALPNAIEAYTPYGWEIAVVDGRVLYRYLGNSTAMHTADTLGTIETTVANIEVRYCVAKYQAGWSVQELQDHLNDSTNQLASQVVTVANTKSAPLPLVGTFNAEPNGLYGLFVVTDSGDIVKFTQAYAEFRRVGG